MLPDILFKPRPVPRFDEKRTKWIIRVQGALNIILALGIISVISWVRFDQSRTAHRIIAESKNAPADVTLQTKVFSGDRLLKTTDTVETPFVTIYGRLENYDTIRKTVPDLSITVDGTTVTPNQKTGDFLTNKTLDDGMNAVVIAVSWDGAEKYRTSYALTYKSPPQILTETSGTGEVTP
jgi:hypothetical protein